LSELFGDTFKIRKWHMNLLPEDILSINNALIIEKTKAFILLIDPQVQGVTWLKKMHDSTLTTLK
jgi:dynein heavy chain